MITVLQTAAIVIGISSLLAILGILCGAALLARKNSAMWSSTFRVQAEEIARLQKRLDEQKSHDNSPS